MSLNTLRHLKRKKMIKDMSGPLSAYFVEGGRELYSNASLIELLSHRVNYPALFSATSPDRVKLPFFNMAVFKFHSEHGRTNWDYEERRAA